MGNVHKRGDNWELSLSCSYKGDNSDFEKRRLLKIGKLKF